MTRSLTLKTKILNLNLWNQWGKICLFIVARCSIKVESWAYFVFIIQSRQNVRDHRNCFEICIERQAWWVGRMTIKILNCRILKRWYMIKRNKDGSKASDIEKWENWKSWKTIQNVNVLFLNVLNLTWQWDIKHRYSVFIEH